MKQRWIQSILVILSIGILLASFPLFAEQIELADAEVDWQNDSYINEFGDEVIPISDFDATPAPLDSSALCASLPLLSESASSAVSSLLLSSIGTSSTTKADSSLPLSSATSKPNPSKNNSSKILSSKPISSKNTSSKVVSSKPTSSKAISSKATATSSGNTSSSSQPTTDEKVVIMENGKPVTYSLSYLLPRIVEAEISGGSPIEAVKAQAVATHTFLRYYNDQGTAPAVNQKAATAKAINACNAVMDKLITVNGKPVYTPYCAATAGKTNSSADVWGGKLSHLQSVESIYDSEDKVNWNRQTAISVQEVKSKLTQRTGLSITGDPSSWLTRIDLTAGGYNKNMKICGKTTYLSNNKTITITGRVIRENLLNLRSACFEWKVQGDQFIFTTKGYGHGAGMSQMGAIGYARHGYTHDQILKHYYTGVTISAQKGSN